MTRAWFFVCGVLLAGCGTVMQARTALPSHAHRDASMVKVGTARAELTMPPGAATFGHALDARVADGYWARTYCRVFFFETEHHDKLAIIPCELSAISSLLQRKVAEQVADLLHPSQLMMTAVHTHAAVGHYFGEGQYVGPASTRRPGFDEDLLNALVDSIANAIREAHEKRKPATLTWRHEQDFWCFSRNRDLAAYELNDPPFYAEPPAAPPAGAPACDLARRKDYRAIDPAMHVLRIDQVDPDDPTRVLGPIGSISLFALHPTILGSKNRLFGGDTTGMVNRHVERELRREWTAKKPALANCLAQPTATGCSEPLPDPLHGVINTNEGDLSPIWTRGDTDEAIAFGRTLAEFVWRHHPPPATKREGAVIDLRYVEDDIRDAAYVDPADGKTRHTCDYPELGQGSAAGASDHPTTVAALPLLENNPTRRAKPKTCQGVKLPLLGPLSCMMRTPGAFPAILPLAVVRIGDTLLGFIPTEATVTAGHRITDRMLAQARESANPADAPAHAVIAGLANSYIQYLATTEEYDLQGYEGASTLYGPNENAYFADRMQQLTRLLFDPKAKTTLEHVGEARRLKFPVGSSMSVERMAQPTCDTSERKHLRTCTMPNTADAPRICMYFLDDGPGDVPLRDGPWIRLVDANTHGAMRTCHVAADAPSVCDFDGTIDDRSHEFRTRIHDEAGGGFLWSTLFSPDAALWQELGEQRVRIEAAGDGRDSVYGTAFSRSALPCTCTTREASLCIEGVVNQDLDSLIEHDKHPKCTDATP